MPNVTEELYCFKNDKTKACIYVSSSEPTSQEGKDGDLWLVYDVPPVVPTAEPTT